MADKRIIISIFIVFMLVFSSLYIFGGTENVYKPDNTKSNYNDVKNCSLGNYDFQASCSGITNLMYNNNVIANYINISGNNANLPLLINNIINLKNATVLLNGNSLFIFTKGYINMQFNKSFNFNDSIINSKNIGFLSMGVGTKLFNVYSIYSYNYSGYFMTDGSVIASGNNISIYSNKTLVIGFSLGQSLNSYLNSLLKERNNYKSQLADKNNNISGTYINLFYNNGIFSNIKYKNISLFNKLYVTGNGEMKTDFLKNNSILLDNNLLTYFNNTAYIAMYNNPELESNIFINNGTLHLLLNKNETFYNTSFPGINSSYMESMKSFSSENPGYNTSSMISILNFNHIIRGEDAIYINDGSIQAKIFMNNLSYTYNNHEINISSDGMLSLIVNPAINSTYNRVIMHGISKGMISSEMLINYNSTEENTVLYYNSSIAMSINKINNTNIIINVSSTERSGTIVLFSLSKSIINSNNIYIKFDNHISKYTDINGIMNMTSKNTSYYTYINYNSYTYILLYIPHFSNHTVDITDVKPVKNNINYYEIGVIAIIVMASIIAGIAINKRKK